MKDDAKQVMPVSVFGWTGTMSVIEKKICEFSISCDPTGQTIAQFVRPRNTESARKHNFIAEARIRKVVNRGRGSRAIYYEFAMKKDGGIVLSKKDSEEDIERHEIPAHVVKEAFDGLQAWYDHKASKRKRKMADDRATGVRSAIGSLAIDEQLLDRFVDHNDERFLFERLVVYIRTLGRKHGRNTRAVHVQGNRGIAPEQRQRGADKAAPAEDIPGGGEAVPAPEWD